MSVALGLGLAAAASYGVGDFFQGLSSRRMSTLTVLAVGQLAGLVVVVGTVALSVRPPTVPALLWGSGAGVAAAAGTYLLLRGFRTGRLGVVSPTASVAAAGLPLVVDIALGTRLGPGPSVGVVLAVAAIVLVSRGDSAAASAGSRSGLGFGLGAGVAHAGMYLCLDRAGSADGGWPVVATYVVLVGLGFLAVLVGGRSLHVPIRNLPVLLLSGGLGALGTVLFLLATAAGTVGPAAVTVELSPVLTVVLARFVLAERLPATRIAGLVVAVAGLTLIGGG